jgi:hypothetical protein
MTAEVKEYLESQRLLIRQLRRSAELLQGVFDMLEQMPDDETRAIVDTSFVDELLKTSEHLRKAEEALLAGVRETVTAWRPDSY